MKLRVHKAKLNALLSKDHITDINVADSLGWTPMAMAIEIANVDIQNANLCYSRIEDNYVHHNVLHRQ